MVPPILTPIYCPDCKSQVRPEQVECSICGASLVRAKKTPELKPSSHAQGTPASKPSQATLDPLSSEILRQYRWLCGLQTVGYCWIWAGATLMLVVFGPTGIANWAIGIPIAIIIGILLDIPKGSFRRGVASRGIDAAKWAAQADTQFKKSLFIVPPIGVASYLLWLYILPIPILWALGRPTLPRMQASGPQYMPQSPQFQQPQTRPSVLLHTPLPPEFPIGVYNSRADRARRRSAASQVNPYGLTPSVK